MTNPKSVDPHKVRVACVEQRVPQWRLARLLSLAPSTLSDYLRGARPAPPNLAERIERALGRTRGSLTVTD
jgi:DNA-binding transcriptional regulator YdaS (Cro superfamily)